jgi:hypothetical protein
LISGPVTLVKLSSPSFIEKMTSEQLRETAGEDARQKSHQKQLQKEIEDFEMGKKIFT